MAAKTKAALAAAEKTLDKVEPVLERIESEIEQTVEAGSRIPKLWLNGTTKKQQVLILSITAFTGAVAGAAAAFPVLKKKLRLHYEEVARVEIEDAKEFYEAIHNKPELSDLVKERHPEEQESTLIQDAADAVVSYGGHKLGRIDTVQLTPEGLVVAGTLDQGAEIPTSNIFVEGRPVDENFDYDAEIAQRTEDAPYIISKMEYDAGEKEYEQAELTFYEGDDTLADDRGKHIPDADDAVGDLNLHRFGHGSGDNNVLYVRNDRLETDFVVLRSTGEYAKEVLGLRHSDRGGSRKQPRARWGDDE